MDAPPEGLRLSSATFGRRRRILRFLPPVLLITIPTILVLLSAGGGFTLWGSDMIMGSFHIRGLVGRFLREGHFPVWDPHTMCGFPLLAAMQGGVFYPLTWPAAFLSPGPFWTATVLVHLILAGLFSFGWLKKGLGLCTAAALIGACVFMLSAYLLSRVHAGHVSQMCSYPWIAAVLWRAEDFLRRPALRGWILLSGAVALLVLPGFPQFPHIVAILMGVRLAAYQIRAGRAGWRISFAAAGAGFIGVVFCAPQLLPTLELIPEAARVSGGSYDFASQLSLPFHDLIGLLVPSFFGDDSGFLYWGRGGIWESIGFVGISALLLGAMALRGNHPQRWFWSAAAGIALLLVLGKEGPLYRIFYEVVPGARLFRPPGRYYSVFTIALTALSAFGVDRWWKRRPGVQQSARRLATAAALLMVLMLAWLAYWERAATADPGPWNRFVAARLADPECQVSDTDVRDPEFPVRARIHARAGLVRASVTFGVCAVILFASAFGRIPGRVGAGAFGTVLLAELLMFGHVFLKPYDPKLIAWPQEFVDAVKRAPGYPFRLVGLGARNMTRVGKCQLAGLDNVGGYESMILRRYSELVNAIHERPPELLWMVATMEQTHPVLDMLGVRLWLVARGQPPPTGWRTIGAVNELDGESVILESPGAFPRAFCVPGAVVIASRDKRLRVLLDPATDFRKVVVLESESSRPGASRGGGPATATVTSFSAGAYEIRTEAAADGYLVLSETWYPGWEAWIDGAPAELLRANHFIQAIRLPAGRHEVRFAYHSRRLLPGLLVSGAILLAMLGATLIARRRSSAG